MNAPAPHLATVGGLLGLAEEIARVEPDHGPSAAATIVRPLRELGEPAEPVPGLPPQPLAALAAGLVARYAEHPNPAVLEACAGALRLLDPETARELGRALPPSGHATVTVRTDGPYLVTGGPELTSWLGVAMDAAGVVALCRCGRSAEKPLCDGTHAGTGFSGAKRADRVPERLDRYPARQFDVLDDRGLCAHSGRCTDALPGVFRVGEDPFVAPAGGRADDILRAVQACPSGALGAAIADREARELVDTTRDPAIEVSLDGPYRLTGAITVIDDDGAPVQRPEGHSPEHSSLCRCGQSSNKPFCSGAHWNADFHDPAPADEPTLFDWAGGYPALLRMTRLFYERHVAQDDLLAPLFARMEPDHPERVAAWLSEVFGGPELYSRRYGDYTRMISQHLHKHLDERQRSRWVQLLARSADEALLPADPEFRSAFVAYVEWGSRIAVENSTEGAQPPPNMPVPKWWWVCNATPAARVRSLPAAVVEPEPEVATPGPDEPVGFDRHVRGLFRARDRGSMRFAFDLWSHDDVTTHADAILARLREGTMPCDGPWPDDRVAVFERWITGDHRA